MKIAVPNLDALPYLKNSLKSRHGRQWLVLYLVFGFSVANLGFSAQARAECRQGCDSSGFDAFLGEDALLNANGGGNVAIGWHALQNNTGLFNIGIGEQTLANSSAGENVAVGTSALWNNTTGYLNTAIGEEALSSNSTGILNTAIGADAMQGILNSSTGSNNTATGYQALFSYTTRQQQHSERLSSAL